MLKAQSLPNTCEWVICKWPLHWWVMKCKYANWGFHEVGNIIGNADTKITKSGLAVVKRKSLSNHVIPRSTLSNWLPSVRFDMKVSLIIQLNIF